MKPIFPVNLCRLVDRLFTEFENAEYISILCNSDVSIAISNKTQHLAMISLHDDAYLNDTEPWTIYDACKQNGKIKYLVRGYEAVSGLELEKSMKKLKIK